MNARYNYLKKQYKSSFVDTQKEIPKKSQCLQLHRNTFILLYMNAYKKILMMKCNRKT